MKTLEGNKLIAEFMGIRFNNGNAYDSEGNPYMRFRCWNNDMARNEFFRLNKMYDNSWDMLMPVVEKCTKIGYANENETIDEKWESIFGDNDSMFLGNHINEVWKSIIEFIQWYNKQNKQL